MILYLYHEWKWGQHGMEMGMSYQGIQLNTTGNLPIYVSLYGCMTGNL